MKQTGTLKLKTIGLILGPMAFLFMMLGTSPDYSTDQWRVMAVGLFMLIWWVTEAVPIAVTSLLPLVLFPFMGVMNVKDASSPYGSDIVFLFLGGFLIALALEKWNLHKRIALNIVRLTGTKANRVVLGFMLSSGILSMWISNTATTVMMLPIAMSVIHLLANSEQNLSEKSRKNFNLSLLLGVAYGANAGGIGTLIGTPPNLVLAGYFRDQLGIDVSFFDWMKIGLPFSILLLFLIYFMLVYVLFPNRIGNFKGIQSMIAAELKSLGAWSVQERRVLLVFGSTAVLWVLRGFLNDIVPWIQLNDTGIAITGAIVLFVIPNNSIQSESLLNWNDSKQLPWGILLLFGGGLCLAGAFRDVGLIEKIGVAVQSAGFESKFALMLLLGFIALFLTEVMSNVALTTVFVPVVVAIALGLNLPPEYFAIPVTVAASCAFMLPMSTPPNAIVFASGHIRILDMARAGLVLNVMVILIISVLGYLFLDGFKF